MNINDYKKDMVGKPIIPLSDINKLSAQEASIWTAADVANHTYFKEDMISKVKLTIGHMVYTEGLSFVIDKDN